MALFDFFKRKKESERFTSKRAEKKEKATKLDAGEEKKAEPEGFREINQHSKRAFRTLVVPHVTEKATFAANAGAYIFKVKTGATKKEIALAIKELYGVKVRHVNLINIPAKKRYLRGRIGMHAGHRKAVVYLEAGEKLEVA
ncbi:50S ribosomal protein L23 [Candidatus Giovannonibacteria bacterium]|nr:50S ribosomal protein L23 [Candidatus Giovannonibacteria bacterium]